MYAAVPPDGTQRYALQPDLWTPPPLQVHMHHTHGLLQAILAFG